MKTLLAKQAPIRAVEFFSGIGGFHQSVKNSDIKVVAAFDQSEAANLVYMANYGMQPSARNLDSITVKDIPDAQIWWLSPPCKPYTVRGKRNDRQDPRAASLLNLIKILPEKRPDAFLMENVLGFSNSQMRDVLTDCLSKLGYAWREFSFSSTTFGAPMKRPRYFLLALSDGSTTDLDANAAAADCLLAAVPLRLKTFLDTKIDPRLFLPDPTRIKFAAVLNEVSPDDENAMVICFTSGYWDCRKASGSLLQEPDGRLRRFSPGEIVRLLGFDDSFAFPAELSLKTSTRLAGNSVDVRAIRFLLSVLGLPVTALVPQI